MTVSEQEWIRVNMNDQKITWLTVSEYEWSQVSMGKKSNYKWTRENVSERVTVSEQE